MQLAKSILRNKLSLIFSLGLSVVFVSAQAQDNSPYSRYGLGNEYPKSSIINRSMGGVAVAYGDITSVNYTNPASYAGFQAIMEQRSNKVAQARVIFDAGININSRTLSEPNTTNRFTSSDALFSHIYVGIPIRKNWGMSFGIRPLSRISYDIFKQERLRTPSGQPIDSAITQFTGSGGSFLPSIGTGFGSDNFRVGFNISYLFGKKETTTRRAFINDSVEYAASNHTINTSFGNVFFTVGAQYLVDLNENAVLRLGASGNWKQNIKGSQDILRQTYLRNASGQEMRVDSVLQQTDIAGQLIYPSTYTAGFMLETAPREKRRGVNFGADYSAGKWNDYRFFGATDFVQNNWELKVGAQLTPSRTASRYGQFITYRFGLFTGRDYIKVDNDLPVYGLTFGLGLPLRNYSRLSSQASIINLGVEYLKRGNDDNKIKESLFRISLGLNFTDFWFGKRKYD